MDHYALRDLDDRVDGEGLTWWLYFDVGGNIPHVGPFPLEKASERGWWRVPSGAEFDPATTVVEIVRPGGSEIVGYRRTLETTDPAYPETLPIDEYHERIEEELDSRVAALYVPDRRERATVREPVEATWLVLDGAPPPADGFEWIADLPHSLRQQPQYRHLFPGRFAGFRDALKAALEEVPGVSVYGASSSRVLSVSIRLSVPKLEPPERWAAKPNLEGRSARERKKALEAHNSSIQQITRQLEIPCSDYVEGTNRAVARSVWDLTIAEVVEYVRDVVAQKCPTCGGRGFVEPHHEED